MNYLKANELKYTTGVTCLIEASERLRSLPTLALGHYDDLIDAEIIASAYEQIAEALESLQEVGVPFETIQKRLEGITLTEESSCQSSDPSVSGAIPADAGLLHRLGDRLPRE